MYEKEYIQNKALLLTTKTDQETMSIVRMYSPCVTKVQNAHFFAKPEAQLKFALLGGDLANQTQRH